MREFASLWISNLSSVSPLMGEQAFLPFLVLTFQYDIVQ